MSIETDLKIVELKLLLCEIVFEDYTNISQVVGGINNRIEELEGMTPEKYHKEAVDTHNTTSEYC